MSRYRVLCRALFVIALMSSAAPSALAQPLGTFQWQLAPYCNVVTVDVVQVLETFTLSGTDKPCHTSSRHTVTGTAFVVQGAGEVKIGLTINRPDNIAVTVIGNLVISTLAGSWSDDFGNSGNLVPNPALPAPGVSRPVTLIGVYSAGFGASGAGVSQLTPISFGRALDDIIDIVAPPANIIPFGAAPTANCPGSFATPSAARGQLCLYERSRINASYRVFDSGLNADVTDDFGAHLQVSSQGVGNVVIAGAWAASIR